MFNTVVIESVHKKGTRTLFVIAMYLVSGRNVPLMMPNKLVRSTKRLYSDESQKSISIVLKLSIVPLQKVFKATKINMRKVQVL